MDEFETYEDVIDAYNANDMGYSTLTDYIKGQNIKIKEISMEPLADLQKSLFENKADGGMIGIEVLFKDKKADGGRVPAVSGGFLKLLAEGAEKGKQGIMELIETGKSKFDDFVETQANKKMFRSVDDIPPTSISQAKGPMTIEMMEAVDPSIVRKLLRTQELGLYEETPEILKAANLLERFTKKVKGKRVIDYERAEAILGVPLKGDETINDLFKIEFETRPVEKMADGGRVGLFMGGDPLTGQALQIYNSMNAYGFSDQEIADALSARGLYTAPGSGTTQPEQVTGIIGSQLNQGGDDKPMIQPFKQDPRVGSAFEAYQRNQALSAMGINDPFANEATLAGAYYGDMPNVNLQPGSQTFMGKVKSGIDSMLSLSPTINFVRGIGEGIANIFPVNQRAIAENVAGNMGIAVDDIGRIVNTGNYQDPSNIMAGYNLNKMTDETFDKRIDRTSKTLSEKYGLSDQQIQGILEGTLSDEELNAINAKAIMPGTTQTTNLIKQLRSLNIAKDRNKFIQETAQKEAERQEQIKLQKKIEAQAAAGKSMSQIGKENFTGEGMAFAPRKDTFTGGKTVTLASGRKYSSPRKDGGLMFARGGLATMFTRRR